ncbi:XkdF-like putative serine protease domain-containing protein [Halorussus marinus]|uniref:XkdF-like putative serine protease domain-containing protein n=1 Tax=Halorussus marinus TaxID=2505976 RepID=UPI00106ECB35|nr:XkdF-like putative serine protease domain-containing protein [Halorussus marinus]
MPPVAKAGGEQFRKDVSFVAKDDDEQIAAGIVMVPDKADLQNDFAREETIRGFADQFEAFVDAGEAGGGIMHAVFPDGWMELERNEVLDESEEVGGETVDAGAWIQEWRIENDELWSLITDGILEGYSIGAIQVDWNGPFNQDEVDDVAVSDDLGEDALVWELVDGIIREVSAVDIPAVPDAQILETKADAEKRLGDYLGDPDGFVEEALARGHSEEEAERLWEVLNDAVEADGSGEPGEKSLFHRIGKAAVDTFLSGPDATGPSADPTFAKSTDSPECWVCGDAAEYQNEDPPGEFLCAEHADPQGDRVTELSAATSKDGRTLSQSNQESAMAAVDANLDMLEDAGVDHGMTRFTDRDDVDFDLSEHDAREWTGDHDDEGEGEETDVSPVNNAAGGDTPDDTTKTDMPDDDPEGGDDKSLAEENAEQITELTQAVENLTESLTGPEPKTAEIEIDGESYEVPEDAAKAALGVDEEAGVGVADAVEELKEKAERVDEVERRLDTINQQSGHSTQLERSAGEGEEGDESGLKSLGEALS